MLPSVNYVALIGPASLMPQHEKAPDQRRLVIVPDRNLTCGPVLICPSAAFDPMVISDVKGNAGGRVKAKTKFAIGIGIILVSLSALAWMGAKQSQTYYHTVAEISTLNAAALQQRIRVGGDVAAGSIQHLPGRVDFILKEEGKTLPVSYVGSDPPPDTFKDGAQCLIEGHAMPDGRFVAEQLQAKCASKYEAAPGGTESSQPASSAERKS